MIGRPPAEADIQRYFEVTPRTTRQMVLNLERGGWIFAVSQGPRGASKCSSIPACYLSSADRNSTDQDHCAELLEGGVYTNA